MDAHETILKAIKALSEARNEFKKAVKEGLILGNDNHIGDIGEYWVRTYFERKSEFKEYAPKKNAPYDIELTDNTKISVKTITEWSKTGYGTQIKPLCGTDWQLLAAVFLDKNLMASKIALVPLDKLVSYEPFVSNLATRGEEETKAYPRFQWWKWLDNYNVYKHT
jgi:hypothetical protein